MQVVYHRLLTITYKNQTTKLKIRLDSSRADILYTLRARFKLSDDTPVTLVDADGFQRVIDAHLTTGHYQLQTGEGEKKEQKVRDDSRMEGTYGADFIGIIKKTNVFISGMRGLGVETAKNLILTGPRSVTIADDGLTEIADLGTNFYLTEADIGKPRAKCVIEKLAQLNPLITTVTLHEGEITESVLSNFQAIVFTNNEPEEKLKAWNDYARQRGIIFLVGSLLGVTASIFADYGNEFQVRDEDGEPVRTFMVDSISKAANGVVFVDGDRHVLMDDEYVRIDEVLGMSDSLPSSKEVYDQKSKIKNINSIFRIKITKNPKAFTIGDTTGLGDYKKGGIITQVKMPFHIHHASWTSQLQAPAFEPGIIDFSKMGREYQHHFAKLAVFRFQQRNGFLPRLHNKEDSRKTVAFAKEILEEQKKLAEEEKNKKPEERRPIITVEEIDEKLVTNVALYARTELTALSSLFGGVLAQEVMKLTGKYRPLNQWLYFDAFELLDEHGPPEDSKMLSRYAHQEAIFGKAWQKKVLKQKIFMVGCGALGCEYMKAIALSGLGVEGKVFVTDDDNIELSNLGRQFLFRMSHIGHPKSETASKAAVAMNPDLAGSLKAYKIKVEPKTEDVFDDNFWNGIDFVINALDNIQARVYTDSKCVLHLKPLFESGTLGTKANSVTILPYQTPSYAEGVVAGEGQGIAKCTLRNFPSITLHCIEWARERFDDYFLVNQENFNSVLENRDAFFKKLEQSKLEAHDALVGVKRLFDFSKTPTLENCVRVALDYFLKEFRDQIKDLTHLFPEDARKTERTDDGSVIDLGLFWHGHRRFPQAASFDVNDPLHLDFVYHSTAILAHIFKLDEPDRDQVRQIAGKMKIQPWAYSGQKIDVDENKDEKKEAAERTVSDEEQVAIASLTAEIKRMDLSKYKKLQTAEFEKDKDENHHVDFITAATNLRARNYVIKEATRAECRLTAGRIIPAIATTTAMITGFVQLEILKFLKCVSLDKYKQATVNLAVNNFTIESLPDPIEKKDGFDPQTYMPIVAIPQRWTTWDKIRVDVSPSTTIGEFLDKFQADYKIVADNITSKKGDILWELRNDSEEVKRSKLLDAYVKVVGPLFPASRNYILLEYNGETTDGTLAALPSVVVRFVEDKEKQKK